MVQNPTGAGSDFSFYLFVILGSNRVKTSGFQVRHDFAPLNLLKTRAGLASAAYKPDPIGFVVDRNIILLTPLLMSRSVAQFIVLPYKGSTLMCTPDQCNNPSRDLFSI